MRKQVLAVTIGVLLVLSVFSVLQLWQIKPAYATTIFQDGQVGEGTQESDQDFDAWTTYGEYGSYYAYITSGNAYEGTYKWLGNDSSQDSIIMRKDFVGGEARTNFQIAFWTDTYPASGTSLGYIRIGTSGTFVARLGLYNNGTYNIWQMSYWTSGGIQHTVNSTMMVNPSLNTWHLMQVEATQGASASFKSYINGTELTDITQTGQGQYTEITSAKISLNCPAGAEIRADSATIADTFIGTAVTTGTWVNYDNLYFYGHKNGSNFYAFINWTCPSNDTLDYSTFSWNASGSMVNTTSSLAATSWYNFTGTTPATIGTVVQLLYYGNCTSGNSNKTGTLLFTVFADTMALHVEGDQLYNDNRTLVKISGAWSLPQMDASTGWANPLDINNFHEDDVNTTLDNMNYYGINATFAFFLGNYWMNNGNYTGSGGNNQTTIGLVDATKRWVELAADRNIYIQLRLYSINWTERRPEGQPYAPTYSSSVTYWLNMWTNVTNTLKNCSNVLYCLYDEPTGDLNTWMINANKTINAIRGNGTDNIILSQWAYCGDIEWVTSWIDNGYPTFNIVFTEHIYRDYGTFAYNANCPPTLSYLLGYLNASDARGTPYTTGTGYIMRKYNVPILISAIGNPDPNDDENYVAFWNILEALNQMDVVGYVVFHWGRTGTYKQLVNPSVDILGPPNRIGWAFLNASHGIAPPAVQFLNVASTPFSSLSVNVTNTDTNASNSYLTAFSIAKFAGNYTISATPTYYDYQHDIIIGNDTLGGSCIYSTFVATAGPYNITGPETVTSLNFYSILAGNVKVAIYNTTKTYDSSGYPVGWEYPDALMVESTSQACLTQQWNSITFSSTLLPTGSYYLAFTTDTNLMATGAGHAFFGIWREMTYTDPFPSSWGQITQGGVGTELAIYLPNSPFNVSTYSFTNWNGTMTNPTMSLNLEENTSLTAYYTLGEATTVSVTISSPTNTTFTSATVLVTLSAFGGTIDKIIWNCTFTNSTIAYANQTYTTGINMTLTNGNYILYASANNTGGYTGYSTVLFTVSFYAGEGGTTSIIVNVWWGSFW